MVILDIAGVFECSPRLWGPMLYRQGPTQPAWWWTLSCFCVVFTGDVRVDQVVREGQGFSVGDRASTHRILMYLSL